MNSEHERLLYTLVVTLIFLIGYGFGVLSGILLASFF